MSGLPLAVLLGLAAFGALVLLALAAVFVWGFLTPDDPEPEWED